MNTVRLIATRSALILSVAIANAIVAQDDLSSFQEPERVVVTGSLIPTAEEVTATPVDTLGRREIERSGSVQILEILQKREADITGAGNLGPSNANVANGLTQGGSTVQIRGLPTLVLYEGRRIADSAAFATGGLQFADVGVFPSALVSRIEVLKDGASALYGSDAVGGVINIFLKHDYKGVEIGYRYGFTPTSGTQDTLAYIVAGTGNDKTNISIGYQYYQTSGLFERERDFSSPLFGTSSFGGVASFSMPPNPMLHLPRQVTYYLLNPGLNTPFEVPGVTPGSQTALNTGAMANAYSPSPPSPLDPPYGQGTGLHNVIRQFDLSRIPTMLLLQNDQSATASFTHNLLGNHLVLFGDLLYANNHNESFLNPQPLNTNQSGLFIPAGHESTGPGDPTIYNPFDFALGGSNGVRVANRYTGFPRYFTNNTNFIRLLGGLRGQIGQNYTFDAAFYYSSYNIAAILGNQINGVQLNAMIAGTAHDFTGNLIPPLDFFALNPIGTGPGQVSAAQFATIFSNNVRFQHSAQQVADAKFTGFPFQLPGGPFGFAVGFEYRTDYYNVTDSPEIFVLAVPIKEIAVNRSVASAFMELSFPLVSPQMKLPGIYSMDLTLAGRHEQYTGISQDSNVPKVTFRYQPIQDLTLRASFADSFVAPNLYQLYGPSYTGVSDTIILPVAPNTPAVQLGQANTLNGANPNLVPSTAQSYGFGAVYSPKWARGLTISVDYFNVLQKNIVGNYGPQFILQNVNKLGPASPYYGLVRVGSFQGPLISPTAGPYMNGTYVIANDDIENYYVNDSFVNVGGVRVTGIDFSFSYTLDLKRYGTLQFGSNAVYYINNDFKNFPNAPYQSIKGLDFSEGGGGNPVYRVNMLAEYRYQGWTLGFTGLYVPPMRNGLIYNPVPNFKYLPGAFPPIAAYFQIDTRLSYTFSPTRAAASNSAVDPKGVRKVVTPAPRWYDNLTLSVGCNNLFNQAPPYVNGANSNTDLSFYDANGRLVYFQASKKF